MCSLSSNGSLLQWHINKGETVNFKARQLLRKFERIAAKCGLEAIFLNAQPIRLSERLPFIEKSFACDETLDQKQLILWYKKQGYSLDEENENLMCKILKWTCTKSNQN